MPTIQKPTRTPTVGVKRQNEEPGSVEDERTIEEYMKNKIEAAVKDIQDHANIKIKRLREDYQAKATELRHDADISIKAAAATCLQVSLQAIAGPYQKHKPWVFTPATGDSIKLGRSKSKKMVKEGVSLSRDGSVSTQHGKLEVRGGVILYTDTQSSNGSILNGTEIEHHSPATLNSGDELILGDTAFEITIEKL